MATQNLILDSNDYIDVTTTLGLITGNEYLFTTSVNGEVELVFSSSQPTSNTFGKIINVNNPTLRLLTTALDKVWARVPERTSSSLIVLTN